MILAGDGGKCSVPNIHCRRLRFWCHRFIQRECQNVIYSNSIFSTSRQLFTYKTQPRKNINIFHINCIFYIFCLAHLKPMKVQYIINCCVVLNIPGDLVSFRDHIFNCIPHPTHRLPMLRLIPQTRRKDQNEN